MEDAMNHLQLALTTDDSFRTSWRGRAARLLARAASALGATRLVSELPNVVSASGALSELIGRTALVQTLDYRITFRFLPRYPDAPPAYFVVGRFGEGPAMVGGSLDFFSREAAFEKALNESVERAAWMDAASRLTSAAKRATLREMGKSGMNLSLLAGFSPHQRRALPHLLFDEKTEFLWVQGVRIADGEKIWVPLQLACATDSTTAQEPLLRASTSNGFACHGSFAEAVEHGLLELIERDAFMVMYHNALMPRRIDPHTIHNEHLQTVLSRIARYGLSCELLALPTDMPVTVACVILRDLSNEGPALTLGARAHYEPEEALLGALGESYLAWHLTRYAELYKKPLPPRPWDMFYRVAYWAQQENMSKLSWMWEGPLSPLQSGRNNARTLTELARKVYERGCDAVSVRVSPPALEKLGFYVAGVVSPELQPLSLDSDPPYLGGMRLRSVPLALGLTPREHPPDEPHPFP
ncbi:YcaO-like family protein [Candidatus Kaiserbacteria bacterium]|nr:YcaO-like family protein [Candidatus Kaiserbacteria bacterium]